MCHIMLINMFPCAVIFQEERKSWMEAIRPGSTSQPQVPKPLELYEAIPDNLFDEELHEEPVLRPPEETTLYIDVLPPADDDYGHIYDTLPPDPLQPTHKELYVNLGSDLYSYFDPDELPAAEDPPIPTKQMSLSESGYLPLLTTDYTDMDNSYMGLIYEPPEPPPPPPPPIQPPPPVAKDHSALAQRALQYLDPAQLDILIQMLEKLKGEPGPTAVPRSLSPLPMKKDDDLYENIYSLDVSSEAASVPLKQLPPPDRPVPRKQQFTHKADPFRKQPSRRKPAKESNLGRSLECSAFGTVFSTAVCLPFRAAAEECNDDF